MILEHSHFYKKQTNRPKHRACQEKTRYCHSIMPKTHSNYTIVGFVSAASNLYFLYSYPVNQTRYSGIDGALSYRLFIISVLFASMLLFILMQVILQPVFSR